MGYRVSKRLTTRDYRQPGQYFVTICTYQRAHFFGRIREGEMALSPAGQVAWDYWHEIPQHHAMVRLGTFVVMPNHIHGLLEILDSNTARWGPKMRPMAEPDTVQFLSQISPKVGDLSLIIRGYKGAVTRTVREKGYDFAWQKSFHDHVLREGEAERIRNYIVNNPKNWEEDGFYTPDVGWDKEK